MIDVPSDNERSVLPVCSVVEVPEIMDGLYSTEQWQSLAYIAQLSPGEKKKEKKGKKSKKAKTAINEDLFSISSSSLNSRALNQSTGGGAKWCYHILSLMMFAAFYFACLLAG